MNKIYIIAVFCTIALCTNNAVGELNPVFTESAEKCIATLKVDPKAVGEIFMKADSESNDPKVRCFFKCFTEELKWLNLNTKELSLNGPWHGFDEVGIEIIKNCANSVNYSDLCDKCYHFHKCIVRTRFEYGNQ